jgi:hypothetical protein
MSVITRRGNLFPVNMVREAWWSGWSWHARTNRATLGFMFVKIICSQNFKKLTLSLSMKTAFTGLEGE